MIAPALPRAWSRVTGALARALARAAGADLRAGTRYAVEKSPASAFGERGAVPPPAVGAHHAGSHELCPVFAPSGAADTGR